MRISVIQLLGLWPNMHFCKSIYNILLSFYCMSHVIANLGFFKLPFLTHLSRPSIFIIDLLRVSLRCNCLFWCKIILWCIFVLYFIYVMKATWWSLSSPVWVHLVWNGLNSSESFCLLLLSIKIIGLLLCFLSAMLLVVEGTNSSPTWTEPKIRFFS